MLSLIDSIGGLSSLSSKLKTSMLALLARRTPAELGELPLSSEEDFFITHRAIKLEFIDLEESVINRTVHKSENGGPAQFSPKLFVLIFQVQTFNFDWNFIFVNFSNFESWNFSTKVDFDKNQPNNQRKMKIYQTLALGALAFEGKN